MSEHCKGCSGTYMQLVVTGRTVSGLEKQEERCPGLTCGHEAELTRLRQQLEVATLALGFPIVADHVRRYEEVSAENRRLRARDKVAREMAVAVGALLDTGWLKSLDESWDAGPMLDKIREAKRKWEEAGK